MAETISIPSPSVFLKSPIQQQKRLPHRRPLSPSESAPAKAAAALTKRKQCKSRNGCVTCKAKRLKCDETKPTCKQCEKRSVTCGGYKKDFKWRTFEEVNFAGKPSSGRQKKASPLAARHVESIPPPLASTPSPLMLATPDVGAFPPDTATSFTPMPTAEPTTFGEHADKLFLSSPSFDPATSSPFFDLQASSFTDTATSTTFSDTSPIHALYPGLGIAACLADPSPSLMDLVVPESDHVTLPPDAPVLPSSPFNDHANPPLSPSASCILQQLPPLRMEGDDDGHIEEIVRSQDLVLAHNHGAMINFSSLAASSPSSSSSSSDGSSFFLSSDSLSFMLFEPRLTVDSPEALTRFFDTFTCGILSMRDGPTENPWRTLIWPIARNCPALYHAIASMTSFHASRARREMRVSGFCHMDTSIRALKKGVLDMNYEASIATTLALGFAESWDQEATTGMNHIKGAKTLINQALVKYRMQGWRNCLSEEQIARFRFLCNTWIYMDVLARLTSVDEDDNNDFFDRILPHFPENNTPNSNLDPLMGCASSLFPLIGHAANLIRRVTQTATNSPAIIAQASELKVLLEEWRVPDSVFFHSPEDDSLQIHHCTQTAEAYRWATLLYLHQAVPEIPSLSSAKLAEKTLIYLATVPLTSRAVIVQIFPLMAAGCEATDEDRIWVHERWEAMSSRMSIGNIDRCKDIVHEVWRRRDHKAAAQRATAEQRATIRHKRTSLRSPMKRRHTMFEEGMLAEVIDQGGLHSEERPRKRRSVDTNRSLQLSSIKMEHEERRPEIGTEILDRELTVRGRLHWLGVMKEWDWEVLLG